MIIVFCLEACMDPGLPLVGHCTEPFYYVAPFKPKLL